MALKERFEQFDDQYGKYIGDYPRDLYAFNLLVSLVPDTRLMIGSAEHDEIYIGTDTAQLNAIASDSDILCLVQCGVMYNPEFDCLSMFV